MSSAVSAERTHCSVSARRAAMDATVVPQEPPPRMTTRGSRRAGVMLATLGRTADFQCAVARTRPVNPCLLADNSRRAPERPLDIAKDPVGGEVTEHKRVAVIGAGIAGPVTAKVLRDDAFDVVV